jgi:hypothetical protein
MIPIIEDAPAYWIGPKGQIISNFHIHIEAVIENPQLFGLTLDKIKEAYNKYNEPLRFEGKARVEIMEPLIRNGWIRIRYNPKNDSYSVELNRLSGENSKYLQIWAKGLLKAGNGRRKYSEVKITEFERDFQYTVHSVDDVANWK